MQVEKDLFYRIGVSAIGCKELFFQDRLMYFERNNRIEEYPILEVPAFDSCVRSNMSVYSVHAYKELFAQDPVFIHYYLSRLWNYMNDIDSKLAVFHVEKSISPLMLNPNWFCNDCYIGFENVSDAIFQYAKFFEYENRFGIVLDTAHTIRLGIPIEDYLKYRILHVHVRGWDKCLGYRRIKMEDSHIRHILEKIILSGYKGIFILEYPYRSWEDYIEDRDILKKILEEIVLG